MPSICILSVNPSSVLGFTGEPEHVRVAGHQLARSLAHGRAEKQDNGKLMEVACGASCSAMSSRHLHESLAEPHACVLRRPSEVSGQYGHSRNRLGWVGGSPPTLGGGDGQVVQVLGDTSPHRRCPCLTWLSQQVLTPFATVAAARTMAAIQQQTADAPIAGGAGARPPPPPPLLPAILFACMSHALHHCYITVPSSSVSYTA